MMKPTNVPSWLTMRSGRRPYRSESWPKTGPATSWHSEYVMKSSPTTCGEAP